MPWQGDVADFLAKQKQDQIQNQQTNWSQLLQGAGLAKDIWSTLQDQQSLQPGGARYNFAKQQNQWDIEGNQAKLDQALAKDKSWLDYQNQNPGATQDELKANFYQTDAGKAYLAQQKAIDDAAALRDFNYRMKEIAAGNKQGTMSAAEVEKMALGDVATAYHMPPDGTGGYTWSPTADKEKIRQMLYQYIPLANSQDQQTLKGIFDQWVNSGGSTSTATPTAQTTQAAQNRETTISQDVARVQQAAAKVATITGRMGNAVNFTSKSVMQDNLRELVGVLSSDPSLSPQDKQSLQNISAQFPPFMALGGLGADSLMNIWKTVQTILAHRNPQAAGNARTLGVAGGGG